MLLVTLPFAACAASSERQQSREGELVAAAGAGQRQHQDAGDHR